MDITAANSDDINWLKRRLQALRDFFAKEREGIADNDDLVAKFRRAEDRLQRALSAVERVSSVIESGDVPAGAELSQIAQAAGAHSESYFRAYRSEAGTFVVGE